MSSLGTALQCARTANAMCGTSLCITSGGGGAERKREAVPEPSVVVAPPPTWPPVRGQSWSRRCRATLIYGTLVGRPLDVAVCALNQVELTVLHMTSPLVSLARIADLAFCISPAVYGPIGRTGRGGAGMGRGEGMVIEYRNHWLNCQDEKSQYCRRLLLYRYCNCSGQA